MSENNPILVVEDEPSVGEVVSLYLRRAGFSVNVVRDGQSALDYLQQHEEPLMVILDLMLPGLDGWEITRWLRARGDVPIIILSARREEMDRIAGLEMGADDYVVKPFSPQELVSRVRAVVRRTRPAQGEEDEQQLLTVGDMEVNTQTRAVTARGESLTLTAKEFDLLTHMMRHPRQVFSRDQLLERIWGLAEYIDPGTVTVHIRRLREKIEEDPSKPRHLITVWGVGYKFEA